MKNILTQKEIEIPVDHIKLAGELTIPEEAKSIVVFVHGSGSSRHSPRNKQVAERLQEEGYATLLFDLLTQEEDKDYSNRFEIPVLRERLLGVLEWLQKQPETSDLELGLFGASTGAAAALEAASVLGDSIKALVSRGGRPDLASHVLPLVKAPALFIVGGLDYGVITLNEQAFALIKGEKDLVIVEEATHLFDEPGKLEEVIELAVNWFHKHLPYKVKA